MNADLRPVADALAALEDAELHALIDAANELMLMAASLLSWIEHIADWELARRAGDYRRLQPPSEAIPPEDHATSIVAAMMLRARFNTDQGGRRAVVELFDAVVGALGRPGAAARW